MNTLDARLIDILGNIAANAVAAIFLNRGGVPRPQHPGTAVLPGSVPGSDPIAADGEFTIKATDVSFGGAGVPYGFTRYYRSGVSFQTPLGFGWSHNFNRHLFKTPKNLANPRDCSGNSFIYVTPTMDRVLFVADSTTPSGVTTYRTLPRSGLRLVEDLADSSSPWTVYDVDGLLYRFGAPHGELVSISDRSGNGLSVTWEHLDSTQTWELGGRVTRVDDSLGRPSLRFLYATVSFTAAGKTLPFEHLSCVTTDPAANDCSHQPLVSFDATGVTDPTAAVVEFDLTHVADSQGNGPTYIYYKGEATDPHVLPLLFSDYIPSAEVDPFCNSYCGDSASDCRVIDACRQEIAAADAACDDPINCRDSCMSSSGWSDWGGFYSASRACAPAGTSVPVDHVYCPDDRRCSPEYGRAWVSLCAAANGSGLGCPAPTSPAIPHRACDLVGNYKPCPYCQKYANQCHASMTLDMASCRSQCLTSCRSAKTGPLYEYGIPPDVYHNIVQVVDGDGRTVAVNEYGTIPFSPDFDRVIVHTQGSQPDNVIRTSYVDFNAGPILNWELKYVSPFPSTNLCPKNPLSGGYDPSTTASILENFAQIPVHANIIFDIGGITRTVFYDAYWRLLREVNITASGLKVDYNYDTSGNLIGIGYPSGSRKCIEYDDLAHPVLVTDLPTPGSTLPPQVTELTYDNAGELVETVHNRHTPQPYGTQFIRDKWERVIAVGESVESHLTNWTCYSYFYEPPPRPATGPLEPHNPLLYLAPRPPEPADSSFAFVPSGCASDLRALPGMQVSLNPHPTAVVRPDGSLTKFSNFSPFGPQDIVDDAQGRDPLASYVRYDSFGNVKELGRSNDSGNPKPGSVQSATYVDRRLTSITVQAPDTNAPITTVYQYDRSKHLVGIDFDRTVPADTNSARVHRDIEVSPLGDIVSLTDTPRDTTTASRSTCYSRDIRGTLQAILLPSRQVEVYDYDEAGQLTGISRSASPAGAQIAQITHSQPLGVSGAIFSARLGAWATHCGAANYFYPPTEQIARFHYASNGSADQATIEGVEHRYAVDGFGRIIVDTVRPSPAPVGPIERVRGYDTNGRVAWNAVYDNVPASINKPLAVTSALAAMEEYEYDRLGRRTSIKRWLFSDRSIPTPILRNTSLMYTDSTDTVTLTDEEGFVSEEQRDGLGRVIRESTAVGQADQRDVITTYSNGGDVVTLATPGIASDGSPLQLIRKLARDPVGRVLSVTDPLTTAPLLTVNYDAWGRLRNRVTSGRAPEIFEYDAYSRVLKKSLRSTSTVFTTQQTWDVNDNLLSEWNTNEYFGPSGTLLAGRPNVISYKWDGLGRLVGFTDFRGANQANGWAESSTVVTYVPGTRRVLSVVDGAGTRTLGYDGLGRVTSLSAATASDVGGPPTSTIRSFRYTALGQLAQAAQAGINSSTIQMTYDSLGRKLTEANNTMPISVLHSYGPGAEQTAFVVGSAALATKTVQYGPRYQPLALTIQSSAGSRTLASFEYLNSMPVRINFPNGVFEQYQTDGRGREVGVLLRKRDTVSGSVTNISSVVDELGEDGIVRARVRSYADGSTKTDLFEIDDIGRVTYENLAVPGLPHPFSSVPNNADVHAVENSGFPWTRYSLDGNANWMSHQGRDSSWSSPVPYDHYTAINDLFNVDYNAAGELVTVPAIPALDWSAERYSWNAFSELVSATSGSAAVTFKYDALGRRILESDSRGSRYFLWDGEAIVALGEGNDPATARLRLGLGAGDTLALIDRCGTGDAHFVHAGTDGSPFALTSEIGKFVEAYSFSSFGEVTFRDGNGAPLFSQQSTLDGQGNRFLFQGNLYDPSFHLYSMRNREYKPTWGRFLSPDPLATAGGTNLYAFAKGAPFIFTDPNGLRPQPLGPSDPAMILSQRIRQSDPFNFVTLEKAGNWLQSLPSSVLQGGGLWPGIFSGLGYSGSSPNLSAPVYYVDPEGVTRMALPPLAEPQGFYCPGCASGDWGSVTFSAGPVSAQATMDIFGNTYGTGALNLPNTLRGLSLSAQVGWLIPPEIKTPWGAIDYVLNEKVVKPNEETLTNFLSGGTMEWGGCFLFCGGVIYSPQTRQWGIEAGASFGFGTSLKAAAPGSGPIWAGAYTLPLGNPIRALMQWLTGPPPGEAGD